MLSNMRSDMSFTIDTCPHPVRCQIVDVPTATLVCTECALVRTENCGYGEVYYESNILTYTKHSEYLSTVHEYCSNMHIPLSFAPHVCEMAHSLEKKMGQRGMVKPAKCNLLAYCLYNMCQKEDCFRTLSDIEGATGCDLKKLGRMDAIFSHPSEDKHYEQLIDKYCYYLEIAPVNIPPIRMICIEQLRNSQSKPRSIIAACIYTHILNKYPETGRGLIREIAEIVGTTPNTIRKIRNKMLLSKNDGL